MADRRPPRWLATQQRVESCRLLGASEFLCRAAQFGILEQPSILYSSGEVMNLIPQNPEDLRAGCQEGIYEEMTTGEAERIRSTGCYALLRMRPLWISCAEGFVVISCGKVECDKSGWRDN
jgi:hypothetical protein